MDIRAVAFDANGTLVRILTEDGMEEIFRAAAHFLTYQGIDLCRDQVRELYFGIMAEQRQASPEEHPEFDAAGSACTRTPARCSTSCASATRSRWSPTRRAHTREPNCTGSACWTTSTRSWCPATSATVSRTGGCSRPRWTG